MLQNYIDFLKGTIDQLTDFHFDGDIGSYFEAVGLGFLTIFLVIFGVVCTVGAIILPVIICKLPWKLITKKLREQINAAYKTSPEEAVKLYYTYVARKRIYIGVMVFLAIPFVVPFIMMVL